MDKAFSYQGEQELQIGDVVEIEFGRQKKAIIGIKDNSNFKKLKPMFRNLSSYNISKPLIEF